jgi:hypothetical protein
MLASATLMYFPGAGGDSAYIGQWLHLYSA